MHRLIGRGLKRVTLALVHPVPQGSNNIQGPLDQYDASGEHEPLISHAEPNGEERTANSKLKDDSNYIVRIQFKQTEEMNYWTPVDKLGSSVHVAAKVEKRNQFTKPEVRNQGEGSIGPKIIFPKTDSAGQEEKKKMAGNKFPSPNLATPIQPDGFKSMLTGLDMNINEISETFIQNTKERMSRSVRLQEPEGS